MLKVFKNIISSKQNNEVGAIALILVIMITALTIISATVISMVNVSNLMSSYSFSEGEQTNSEMDACLDDALFRLASSSYAYGTYYLNSIGINCYYQISSTISSGLKTVTSTASTTSSLGYWQDTIVAQVNVSSSPIRIDSYKHSNIAYSSYLYCGDGSCNGSETCSSCSADCGSCATCGNSVVETGETCDDGNTNTERCGDGIKQTGGAVYCNSTCTAVITRNETCDYTGPEGDTPGCFTGSVGCTVRQTGCQNNCGTCVISCLLI